MFDFFGRKPPKMSQAEEDLVVPQDHPDIPGPDDGPSKTTSKASGLWSEEVSYDVDVMVSTVLRGSREDDLLFKHCSERSSKDAFSIHTYTKGKEVYNVYRIRYYE